MPRTVEPLSLDEALAYNPNADATTIDTASAASPKTRAEPSVLSLNDALAYRPEDWTPPQPVLKAAPPPPEASDLSKGFAAGRKHGTVGAVIRAGKALITGETEAPETEAEQPQTLGGKFVQGITELPQMFPALWLGGKLGATAGGAIGSMVPGPGTAIGAGIGAVLGAGAGGFALDAAARRSAEGVATGEPTADIAKETLKEAGKGAVLGGATAGFGRLAAPFGNMARLGAEGVALAEGGALLDKRPYPTGEEALLTAGTLGVAHAAGALGRKVTGAAAKEAAAAEASEATKAANEGLAEIDARTKGNDAAIDAMAARVRQAEEAAVSESTARVKVMPTQEDYIRAAELAERVPGYEALSRAGKKSEREKIARTRARKRAEAEAAPVEEAPSDIEPLAEATAQETLMTTNPNAKPVVIPVVGVPDEHVVMAPVRLTLNDAAAQARKARPAKAADIEAKPTENLLRSVQTALTLAQKADTPEPYRTQQWENAALGVQRLEAMLGKEELSPAEAKRAQTWIGRARNKVEAALGKPVEDVVEGPSNAVEAPKVPRPLESRAQTPPPYDDGSRTDAARQRTGSKSMRDTRAAQLKALKIELRRQGVDTTLTKPDGTPIMDDASLTRLLTAVEDGDRNLGRRTLVDIQEALRRDTEPIAIHEGVEGEFTISNPRAPQGHFSIPEVAGLGNMHEKLASRVYGALAKAMGTHFQPPTLDGHILREMRASEYKARFEAARGTPKRPGFIGELSDAVQGAVLEGRRRTQDPTYMQGIDRDGSAEGRAKHELWLNLMFAHAEHQATVHGGTAAGWFKENVHGRGVRFATEREARFGGAGGLEAQAWHGSGARFEKFDSSKIGTGEGAQAYGHGLYFAGNREVGEWYRKKATREGVLELKDGRTAHSFLGQNAGDVPFSDKARDVAESLLYEFKDVPEALDALETRDPRLFGIQEYTQYKAVKEEAARLLKLIEPQLPDKGQLYRVELAPREDEYLDWDKPLSEQSETVRQRLHEGGLWNEPAFQAWKQNEAQIRSLPATDVYGEPSEVAKQLLTRRRELSSQIAQTSKIQRSQEWQHVKGEHLYDTLSADNVGYGVPTARASEHLHSLGIRGIRYADATSRGRGNDSYNYVLFSDADVTIQETLYARQRASTGAESGVVTGLTQKAKGTTKRYITILPTSTPEALFHELHHVIHPLEADAVAFKRIAGWINQNGRRIIEKLGPDQVDKLAPRDPSTGEIDWNLPLLRIEHGQARWTAAADEVWARLGLYTLEGNKWISRAPKALQPALKQIESWWTTLLGSVFKNRELSKFVPQELADAYWKTYELAELNSYGKMVAARVKAKYRTSDGRTVNLGLLSFGPEEFRFMSALYNRDVEGPKDMSTYSWEQMARDVTAALEADPQAYEKMLYKAATYHDAIAENPASDAAGLTPVELGILHVGAMAEKRQATAEWYAETTDAGRDAVMDRFRRPYGTLWLWDDQGRDIALKLNARKDTHYTQLISSAHAFAKQVKWKGDWRLLEDFIAESEKHPNSERTQELARELTHVIEAKAPHLTDHWRDVMLDSLLLGGGPIGRNAFSNTLRSFFMIGTRGVAGGVDWLTYVASAGKVKRNIYASEALVMLREAFSKRSQANQHLYGALMGKDVPGYHDETIGKLDAQISSFDNPNASAIAKKVGKYFSLSRRLMLGTDMWFSTFAYYGELEALRFRKDQASADPRWARLFDPEAKVRDERTHKEFPAAEQAARLYARYAYYNDAPGNVTKALMKFRDSLPYNTGYLPLPFLRVPMNIIRGSIEYTPLLGFGIERYERNTRLGPALEKDAKRFAEQKAKDAGYDPDLPEWAGRVAWFKQQYYDDPLVLTGVHGNRYFAARSEIWARQIVGGAVMTAFYSMFQAGIITAGYSDNPKERAAQILEGFVPWSIAVPNPVGGGTIRFQYSKVMEPFSIPIMAMVQVWDYFKDYDARLAAGEEPDAADTLLNRAAGVIADTYVSNTWLRNINSYLDNTRTVQSKFLDTVDGLVPYSTLQRDIARMINTSTERSNPELKGVIGGLVQVLPLAAPILDANGVEVPRRINRWGKEQPFTKQSLFLTWLPITWDDGTMDPVDAELHRLGWQPVQPNQQKRVFRTGEPKRTVPDDLWMQFKIGYGMELKKYYDKQIDTAAYQALATRDDPKSKERCVRILKSREQSVYKTEEAAMMREWKKRVREQRVPDLAPSASADQP